MPPSAVVAVEPAIRNELRSFGFDAIKGVWSGMEAVHEVTDADVAAVLDSGYGIFSGKDIQWAELEFSPSRAQWVSKETWHPEQEAHFTADGSYRLKLPLSNPTELVMDILHHLPEVRVLSPQSLRESVRESLEKALAII
jgi:predicted DNA-binding transcriptional regulator YafY